MRFVRIVPIFFVTIIFSILIGSFSANVAAIGKKSSSATVQENSPAAPEIYRIDPAHSTIGFNVRHLTINKVPGRFKDYTGAINYNPSDVNRSSVEFTAKVTSIDTGIQQRDDHLRSADFFEVEKYPDMAFKSTRVESKGKNSYVAYGNFTLKGVTKEIAIPFELFGPVKDQRGTMRIGVEATMTINRQDYGVTWSKTLDNGGLVLSNEVNIDLRLEGVRQEQKPTAK
jgi:polyisoprenoid-binding protein YceI